MMNTPTAVHVQPLPQVSYSRETFSDIVADEDGDGDERMTSITKQAFVGGCYPFGEAGSMSGRCIRCMGVGRNNRDLHMPESDVT